MGLFRSYHVYYGMSCATVISAWYCRSQSPGSGSTVKIFFSPAWNRGAKRVSVDRIMPFSSSMSMNRMTTFLPGASPVLVTVPVATQ